MPEAALAVHAAVLSMVQPPAAVTETSSRASLLSTSKWDILDVPEQGEQRPVAEGDVDSDAAETDGEATEDAEEGGGSGGGGGGRVGGEGSEAEEASLLPRGNCVVTTP